MGSSRLWQAVHNALWAITPEKLMAVQAVLARWEAGERLSDAEHAAWLTAAAARGGLRSDPGNGNGNGERHQRGDDGPTIAVLPVYGVLAPRLDLVRAASGGTSTERLRADLRTAVQDPQVSAIVLDIDSPGGVVTGVPELAADVYAARQHKPIIAVANHLAASAAYWIGSAASQLVVAPSGEVGSIGVLVAHEDHSARLAQAGVRVSLISAGRYKGEANPYAPLSDAAREHLQMRVDRLHEEFMGAVARHRGVTPARVQAEYGQGRTVMAADALVAGMVDRIATLDTVLAELLDGPPRLPGAASGPRLTRARVQDDAPPPASLAAPADVAPEAAVSPSPDWRRRRLRRLTLAH